MLAGCSGRVVIAAGFLPHLGELPDQDLHGFVKPDTGAWELSIDEGSCPFKVRHVFNPHSWLRTSGGRRRGRSPAKIDGGEILALSADRGEEYNPHNLVFGLKTSTHGGDQRRVQASQPERGARRKKPSSLRIQP